MRERKRAPVLGATAANAYVALFLVVFVTPFCVCVYKSFVDQSGAFTTANYAGAAGTYLEPLRYSVINTVAVITLNLLLCLPAAYAIARYRFPGKNLLMTLFNTSLYAPAIVLGLGALLAFKFVLGLHGTVPGLAFALAAATYPLMLTPLVVALRDTDVTLEEAAMSLGASRLRAFFKVTLPLIGPGISAGVLLCFVVVWNEFIITTFVTGASFTTAPARLYDQVRRTGFSQQAAAAAVGLQLISFLALLTYLRVFGARYLRGRFLA